MKIALLTPEYPHEKISDAAGIGTSIKNLATTLVKQGHGITVIVYGQQETLFIEDEGVNIHLIEDKKYCFAKWYFYRKYIQKHCNDLIAVQKIDIIEAPDWTGITAFMNFNIPLIIRFHGSDTYFCHLENRKQKPKNYWFEKLAVNKAKAFIAPTQFAGELSAKLFGIRNKTIQTIHYGLELKKINNKHPGDYQEGMILYIGTIIRKKGVLELPAIFKLVLEKYPKARLVLIGGDSGDIETESHSTWQLVEEQFSKEDKKKVSYLGKIPYQEVQDYIKKAHICVFPTFAETLGMVTIESMAMQKPVVNSDMGWANELIIDGESGFLIHPKSHIKFAEIILKLLSDSKLCQTIGKKARERVEKVFDIEKIAEENRDFYKSLINRF